MSRSWWCANAAFAAVVSWHIAAAGQTRASDDNVRVMRQALASTGVLRAAFLRDNPVQGRVNAQTGEITGLVADVVQRLATTLGVPYRLVPSENAAAVIRNVDSGSADFGVLAYDVERAAQIDYAGSLSAMRNSYVVSETSPLRRSSDVDRPGIVVGAVMGQTQQLFLSSSLRQATLRVFDTQPVRDAMERLLTTGELSAFAMNRQRALDLDAASPLLKALPDSFVDVAQSFVVRKGDAGKRAVLEPVAAELRASGFVSASIRKAGLEDSAAVATDGGKSDYPITVIAPGKGPYTFPDGYQTPWDRIEILVTAKMSPNLFVLHGSEGLDPAHPEASGGRAMVLFGPDGVLMVDTENRQVADKTLKAIRSFTDAPIRVLVNTHIHSDHTGANAFFAKQGALVFSQDSLRAEMLRPPLRPDGSPGPAPDMAGIPAAVYNYNPAAPGQPAVTFTMNGDTVDFIPMMPSHTAGDTIVRFRQANVIYIEDFYRNFGYPFADQANGGSIKGMLDAIDLIEKMADPDTTLVPGHGTFVKKQDLLPYRAMLVDILAKVKGLRDQGKSLKEVLAANLTAPYDKTTQGDTQQSKDRFITEVYDEVRDFPPVVDGKRTLPRHP